MQTITRINHATLRVYDDAHHLHWSSGLGWATTRITRLLGKGFDIHTIEGRIVGKGTKETFVTMSPETAKAILEFLSK